MNIPNMLTMLRLFLVPVLFYALVVGRYGWALAIFLTAAVSDGLDGWIARRFHQQTRLGAILDPIADKLLVVTAVITLTWLGFLPLWLTVLIISRDLLIIGGSMAYQLLIGAIEIAPTRLSKVNTVVQFLLIVLVLIHAASGWQYPDLLMIFIIASFLSTLSSGLQYVWVWSRKAIAQEKGTTGP
ncbi:MAG: CDP-alcohol phosphatidyltransferase family protein [Acidithiobacillus sp.]